MEIIINKKIFLPGTLDKVTIHMNPSQISKGGLAYSIFDYIPELIKWDPMFLFIKPNGNTEIDSQLIANPEAVLYNGSIQFINRSKQAVDRVDPRKSIVLCIFPDSISEVFDDVIPIGFGIPREDLYQECCILSEIVKTKRLL